ncbi:hypothetical protein AB0F07_39425 [Streptomyces fructofermentans]|uniref:hypothetical protein n=1 Tax=Streptomyces fructofermentans TaxID=152141 RepID=UPI0033C3F965
MYLLLGWDMPDADRARHDARTGQGQVDGLGVGPVRQQIRAQQAGWSQQHQRSLRIRRY